MKKMIAGVCLLLVSGALAQAQKKAKWSGEIVVEKDGVIETSDKLIDGTEYSHSVITNFVFLPEQGTHLTIVCRTHGQHSSCIPLVEGQRVQATLEGYPTKVTITAQPHGYKLVKPVTFESTAVDYCCAKDGDSAAKER